MELTKITNIKFSGIDTKDYPDFSDAYIQSADYEGRPMTDQEIEHLNECWPEFIYTELIKSLY